MLSLERIDSSLLHINFSNIFDRVGNNEIGRNESGLSSGLPGLDSMSTSAFFPIFWEVVKANTRVVYICEVHNRLFWTLCYDLVRDQVMPRCFVDLEFSAHLLDFFW